MLIIYFRGRQIFDVSFLHVSNIIAEYYLYNNRITERTFLFGISRDRLDTLSILFLHSRIDTLSRKKQKTVPSAGLADNSRRAPNYHKNISFAREDIDAIAGTCRGCPSTTRKIRWRNNASHRTAHFPHLMPTAKYERHAIAVIKSFPRRSRRSLRER